jgi:hypothetical protein
MYYMTAVRPPIVANNAAMSINTIIDKYKSQPNEIFMNRAPANKSTFIKIDGLISGLEPN